ncbi:MAG: hypothetical protein ACK5M3_05550 [Dysgonomonas sp.]
MKTRKQLIIEANYHFQYKLFLLECENEPFPGSEQWINNIPYMDWTRDKKIEFNQANGYHDNESVLWHYNEWQSFLKDKLNTHLIKDQPQ